MQALFKWPKRTKIWLSAFQFSFLTRKSQVSKVFGHKAVLIDLQDILMHAEVLCWLKPKLGTAPRPAGTHNCDSSTCTDIHEVRVKLKRAEQCKRRKRLCGSSEFIFDSLSCIHTACHSDQHRPMRAWHSVLQVGFPLEIVSLISICTGATLHASNNCMKKP